MIFPNTPHPLEGGMDIFWNHPFFISVKSTSYKKKIVILLVMSDSNTHWAINCHFKKKWPDIMSDHSWDFVGYDLEDFVQLITDCYLYSPAVIDSRSLCYCNRRYVLGIFFLSLLLVSIQCLEAVYNINRSDPSQVEKLKCDKPLEEIFKNATQVCSREIPYLSLIFHPPGLIFGF